jgi:hypothetical protein
MHSMWRWEYVLGVTWRPREQGFLFGSLLVEEDVAAVRGSCRILGKPVAGLNVPL